MKILYAGGGTMGSVSPLIAIHQKLVSKFQVPNYQSLWLGTIFGMERELVEKAGIKFEPIESGKLRRYFALENVFDIFRIIIGFFQALYWLVKFEPDIVLTAGSFVAVPVAYAAFFYNAPVFAHQQDVKVGLANKLMAPVAKKINVALEKSLKDFNQKKVVLVGNPIRDELRITDLQHRFDFENNLPIVLILGGGTGALAINELIWQSLSELIKFCNIIHITGKDKSISNCGLPITDYELQYKSFEFLDAEQISEVYNLSNIAISRAGMATLTELAYFKKPTIIIPMPDTHQEANAEYFAKNNAGIYLKQKELTAKSFVQEIKNLLVDETKKKELGENMNQIFVDYSGEKYLEEILN